MKKTTLGFALLFCLNILSAQGYSDAWRRSDGSLEGFVPGGQFFTFVTDANLRDRPGTQSKVLGKLPIGTPVAIEAVSEETFSQRGVTLPWVKVKARPVGAAAVSGYVWGGFLALASIQTPDEAYMPNQGTLYLTGVTAFDEAKHQITVQVRIAKDGKELAKTEFTTQGDLSYYPSFEVDFPPLKNVKAMLSVNYYYPACGYPSGNNLLFWLEDGQLTKVLETSSISDGGVFYDSENYIMPHEKGGIGDHIIVVKDHSEFVEKGDDYVRSAQSYKITLYKWNGSKLMKVKEMK
jgi:hypothetical protein